MIDIPFSLHNPDDFERELEVFEFGVPCLPGEVKALTELRVADLATGSQFPAAATVVATWPDGSVKWLRVVCQLSLHARQQKQFALRSANVRLDLPGLKLTQDEGLAIQTELARFAFQSDEAGPLPVLSFGGTNDLWRSITTLDLSESQQALARVEQWTVDDSLLPLKLMVTGEGSFVSDGVDVGMRFISQLSFYAQNGLVCWDFTVWNPAAAAHPGGCWDLGDPSSILFNGLSTRILPGALQAANWKTNACDDWRRAKTWSLYQESSGGENWRSRVHVNRDNKVPELVRGYRGHADREQLEGLRASPFVHLNAGEASLSVHLSEFWQNFPKALRLESDGALQVDFFPSEFPDLHELQPGERKTHRVWLRIDAADEPGNGALDWAEAPIFPQFSPERYRRSGVFGELMPESGAGVGSVSDPLRPLLQLGLEGPRNFMFKRELIDEFGWRNFGDVYADHETLYQKPDEAPLVSHYNNQYDPIMGFARQFALTADARWFHMLDELARHVSDIDIYHTTQDKVEYNGGLFWHTDHYLPAHTCTHRTFTRFSTTSSTEGQTGGGPGSEHCYSTGLLYHYYLTGNPRSREAVLSLANWMWRSQVGADGLLPQIWSAKKHELTKIIARLKGRKMLPYRYPFTRGTGNYIVALLDAYELTADKLWLERTEDVIQNTAHPADDIAQRNLGDIEATWSYVVFLQALLKFLALKERAHTFDRAWHYARQTLSHYVLWMLEHESPYRSREDILEFPNDTWVAQEIRKATLFAQAARFIPAQREALLAKGREFLVYIVNALSISEERHYSRVQIVLLQSHGAHAPCLKGVELKPLPAEALQDQNFGSAPKLSISRLSATLLLKILRGLRHFSPAKELAWLRQR